LAVGGIHGQPHASFKLCSASTFVLSADDEVTDASTSHRINGAGLGVGRVCQGFLNSESSTWLAALEDHHAGLLRQQPSQEQRRAWIESSEMLVRALRRCQQMVVGLSLDPPPRLVARAVMCYEKGP